MGFVVDPKSNVAPSEQIGAHLRLVIAAGALTEGRRLPSVRQLAVDALVNPNTVAKAYRALENEQIVETRAGDGVFVAIGAIDICKKWRDIQIRARLRGALGDAMSAGLTQGQLLTWIGEIITENERIVPTNDQILLK